MDLCVEVEEGELLEKLKVCTEKLKKVEGEEKFDALQKVVSELNKEVHCLKKLVNKFLKWKRAEEKLDYYTSKMEGW